MSVHSYASEGNGASADVRVCAGRGALVIPGDLEHFSRQSSLFWGVLSSSPRGGQGQCLTVRCNVSECSVGEGGAAGGRGLGICKNKEAALADYAVACGAPCGTGTFAPERDKELSRPRPRPHLWDPALAVRAGASPSRRCGCPRPPPFPGALIVCRFLLPIKLVGVGWG